MSVEKLNDDVETAEGFCYFGNTLNASVGSTMAVVVRIRLIKVQMDLIFVSSAILYESELLC